MNEEMFQEVAGQLRNPVGESGVQMGLNMNNGNLHINLNAINALNLKDGDNVLEIGMGNGFFAKNILSVGGSIKYTGCDYSQTMVDESIKMNAEFINSKRAQFFLAESDKLPFEKNTFDKVITVNTLYFWENITDTLNEIHRVLKPSGLVIIAIRPKRVMEKYAFTKYGFNMFSKEELVGLLTGNSFPICEIKEYVEPEQEINGVRLPVEALVVSGMKMYV